MFSLYCGGAESNYPKVDAKVNDLGQAHLAIG